MFTLRLYSAIAKLTVCLKSENWHNGVKPVRFNDLQESHKAFVDYVQGKTQSFDATNALQLENTDALVSTVTLTAGAKYHLSVIDMTAKLLADYLQFVHSLSHSFPEAHYRVMQHFLDQGDASHVGLLDELIKIECVLSRVTPSVDDLKLFIADDQFQGLKKLLANLFYNHWPALLEHLNKIGMHRSFLRTLASNPEIARHVTVLLEMPVRLKNLFDQIIDFDKNVNVLRRESAWYLAEMVRDLHNQAILFFQHAKTRQLTYSALQEVTKLSLQLSAPPFLKKWWHAADVAADIDAIKPLQIALVDVFSMHNMQTLSLSRELKTVNSTGIRELLGQINNELDHPQHLQIWRNASSESLSTNLMDSIATPSSSSSQSLAATLFTLPEALKRDELATNDQEVGPSEVREMFAEYKQIKRDKKTSEAELSYINQPNRRNLGLFFHSFLAKFQANYYGYMAVASGLLKQSNSADANVGLLVSMLGSALGPFGGVIFSMVGTAITTGVHLREKNRAKNIAYLGMQKDVMDTVEKFARELTLQYELQIRLLKSAEVKAEESQNQDTPLLTKFTNSKIETKERFFSPTTPIKSGIKALRKHKFLAPDVEPAQMLAEYAVALIYANLLLTDKVPTNEGELKKFMLKALRENPLSLLRTDDKIFDILNFYQFNVHRSSAKWHASDLFRKPTIAVCNDDGSIDFWGPSGEKKNPYYSRLGTLEEAQALGYVVVESQTPHAESATSMQKK